MSTIALGLLLHFYQPPTQTPDVLARIADECYRPLLRTFRARAALRASVNINAVTTEMLAAYGHKDVVDGLRELAEAGRIELTGSGMFHPILPLLPPDDAERQITLNTDSQRASFGAAYQPAGFFPPELAFAPAIAGTIAAAGHRWMLLSGIACPAGWPLERVHRVTGNRSLAVLFRDDILSNIISFRSTNTADFTAKLRTLVSPRGPRYVVIAMDAETYGHHIPGWEEEFLGRLYGTITAPDEAPDTRHGDASFIIPMTLSEIVDRFPSGAPLTPRASSWSTTKWDLDHQDPFPLWNHPGNELQDLLWRHLAHVQEMVKRARKLNADADESGTARWYLDRAEHSDQFWWASRRPHWSPSLVLRGLNVQREALLNAVRAVLYSAASDEERRGAEDDLAAAHSLAMRIDVLLVRE